MERFFHNKREIILGMVTIFAFTIILVFVVYSIIFLARKSADAFSNDLIKSPEIVKFNLDLVKKLKK